MDDHHFFEEFNSSLTNGSENYTYCGSTYEQFWHSYFPEESILILNLLICLYGIVANVISLVVFSSKKMMNPTNLILAGISFSDLVVMASYIPLFLVHVEFFRVHFPYFEPVTYIFYWNVLQIFHSTSVWLTMMLATYRYVAVLHPFHSKSFSTMTRTKMIIVAVFVVILILGIPSYLSKVIEERTISSNCFEDVYCPEGSIYIVAHSNLEKYHKTLMRNYKFWYLGICCRILPCILLTYVSFSLIRTLMKNDQNRKELINPSGPKTVAKKPTGNGVKKESCLRKVFHRGECECCHFDKTTKMLTVVLLIFLVTEFPAGLMFVFASSRGPEFIRECFHPIRFLVLTLILLSGALNFPVYLTMSENFRQTLAYVVRPRGRRDSNSDLTRATIDHSKSASVSKTSEVSL